MLYGLEREWASLRSTFSWDRDISAVAFSLDGSRVACVFEYRELRLWDFARSEPLGRPIRLSAEYQYTMKTTSIVFSPDGNQIAISTPDCIEIWSVAKADRLISDTSFTTDRQPISLAYLSNDCVVACRRDEHGLDLWVKTPNVEATITSYRTSGIAVCVALSRNGKYCGCLSGSSSISLWDVDAGDSRKRSESMNFELDDLNDKYHALAISCDGTYIAAGSDKGAVSLWNSSTRSVVWKGCCDNSIEQIILSFSNENKHLVTLSDWLYAHVHVWDMAIGTRYENEARPTAIAISPNEEYILTGSFKGLEAWSIE